MVERVDSEDLLEEFDQSREKTEIVQVLKELFDQEKINLISSLDSDEIALVTRLLVIAEMKGLENYKSVIKNYLELQLSKDRKSRTELIDAVKGWSQRFRGLGQRMMPGNVQQPPY